MSSAIATMPGMKNLSGDADQDGMTSAGSKATGTTSKLAAFRASLKNLTATGDGEMARNRLVISLLILCYFLFEWGANGRYLATPVITISLFFTFSLGVALHVMQSPQPNYLRRLVSAFADIGTLSFGLYIGGEVTACTWPVYLWVIYGNAFRFGQHFLAISTVTATVCFAIVISITPFWMQFHNLSLGLLFGLIVLPVYARKLINDLSIARQRAEEANKAKSHFLASVSHELRTPLNAIIGLSECMTTTKLNGEQHTMLSTIHSSGRTLSQLIENLLDFSRLESGAMPCNKKKIALPSFIGDVCGLAAAQCTKPDVSFNLHLKTQIPTHITTDELKLKQILTNFISNAAKFTETGHITLVASAVTGPKGKPAVRFEVKDTGTGISASAQERIFERFTQEDETIVDTYGGTGLGLAIVKQTAELLGGHVGVDSVRGQGSTFWCEIPATKAKHAANPRDISDANVVLFVNHITHKQLARSASSSWHEQWPENLSDYDALLEACQNGREKGHDNVIFTDATTHTLVVEWLRNHKDCFAYVICLTDDEGETSTAECTLQHTSLAQIPLRRFSSQAAGTLAWLTRLRDHRRQTRIDLTPSVTPATILIAEDNAANQLVVQKIMSNAGHDFAIVDDGEGVMSILAKRTFDVILLDINMPVMNGFETIEFIRFAMHDKDVPVIAVTADATPETAERCKQAGFDAVVTKPYDAKSLIATIDRHVASMEPSKRIAAVIEPDCEEDHSEVVQSEEHALESHKNNEPVALDIEQIDQVMQLGGREFFERIVHTYFSECNKRLTELDTCSLSKNKSHVRDIAHAFKSSALNIGATCVVDICNELEENAEAADSTWIENKIFDLHEASEKCCDALMLYIAHQDDEPEAKVAVNFH